MKIWVFDGDDRHEASPADLVAAVRAGVESGTIEGKMVDKGIWFGGAMSVIRGRYLVIPLSDGGEDG